MVWGKDLFLSLLSSLPHSTPILSTHFLCLMQTQNLLSLPFPLALLLSKSLVNSSTLVKPLDEFVLQHTFPPHREQLGLKWEKKNQGVKRRNKPRGGFGGISGSLFLPFSFLEFQILLQPPWSWERVSQHVMFSDGNKWLPVVPACGRDTHRTLGQVRKPASPAHTPWVAIPMKVTQGSEGFWNQKFIRLELVTNFHVPWDQHRVNSLFLSCFPLSLFSLLIIYTDGSRS